jgi:hypothetical protein
MDSEGSNLLPKRSPMIRQIRESCVKYHGGKKPSSRNWAHQRGLNDRNEPNSWTFRLGHFWDRSPMRSIGRCVETCVHSTDIPISPTLSLFGKKSITSLAPSNRQMSWSYSWIINNRPFHQSAVVKLPFLSQHSLRSPTALLHDPLFTEFVLTSVLLGALGALVTSLP